MIVDCFVILFFFFFKQKTAYEMRISDWSSDVCSSDPKTRVKRKERKNISSGVAHVNSSFNNTMITITDAQGNAISWSSSGTVGFKGSRKSTPFAAQKIGRASCRESVCQYV